MLRDYFKKKSKKPKGLKIREENPQKQQGILFQSPQELLRSISDREISMGSSVEMETDKIFDRESIFAAILQAKSLNEDEREHYMREAERLFEITRE
jgi:hypothetical protein